MNPEEMTFAEFFSERVKQKGYTLKKLSETTGISPRHLQEFMSGNMGALPSEPYVRGYLLKLGQTLDFDGEAWWTKIRSEGRIKNSGAKDAMPQNRFLKKSPMRWLVAGVVVLIIIIYFIVELPRIEGKPTLTLTTPSTNPYTASANLFTFQGTAANASSLSVNGDAVTIAPNGTWEKNVLLQSGMNNFEISATKFLGGETDITEEIIYQGSAGTTIITPTSTSAIPSSTASSSVTSSPTGAF